MNQYKKKLNDLYAPISFISLNHKLIEKYRRVHNPSISRFTSYCIITLFHSIVVYIGIAFDKSNKSSSLYKFNQEIKKKKLLINDYKKWCELYSSTFDSVKTIIDLRNKFHAHKDSEFDITKFWEQNPEEYAKVPMIAENCIKLFDILSQEISGYKLSFDSTEHDIIDQFDLIFTKYDS
jgi:hypothetical protein